jgi:pyruvoyl-dependent arginine decarboxylase (PvlArgDC)
VTHTEEAARDQLIQQRLTVRYDQRAAKLDGRGLVAEAVGEMPDQQLDYLARKIAAAHFSKSMGLRHQLEVETKEIGELVLTAVLEYVNDCLDEHAVGHLTAKLEGAL